MRTLKEFLNVRSSEDLSRRQRLILLYVVGLSTIIGSYTLVYNWGMRNLEGDPHTIFQSFQSVVETMTTTGYGADSLWSTPEMNVFVVLMQLTGIGIGFFTLWVLIIPLFKRTAVTLDERLTPKEDHVVIAGYRRDSDVVLDELERLDVSYVLVEPEEDEALRLSNDGYQAIRGDPEARESLERASIGDATLVVVDAGDRNASVALTAMEVNPELKVVCLTESPKQNRALEEVGVDRAVSPHALIGRRLAHKAAASITVPEGLPVGADVEMREVLVRRDSPLHGVTVEDSPLFEHPKLALVAGWFDGELRMPPDRSERLTPNTVLVVAGPRASIGDVRDRISGVRTARTHSNVVIAGTGEGGRAARTALPDDVSTTTIDLEDRDDVDVVGDAGDPETLSAAGIEDATALIVSVDDTATALLAVALARSLTDDLEILARVTEDEKVRTAFDAGADYVLSTQRVTARLLAREIHGEDVVSPVSQIRLVRTDGARFADQSLSEANEGAETGWVVLGVVRDGTFRTEETTRIDDDDSVLVAGTDATIRTFERGTGGS